MAVRESKAGKKVRYPKCQTINQIPDANAQGSGYDSTDLSRAPVPPPFSPQASRTESSSKDQPHLTMGPKDFFDDEDPAGQFQLEYKNPRHLIPKQGVFAGIVAMIFGVIHLGMSWMAGMSFLHLRRMQEMTTQSRPPMPANFEAGISGLFMNTQMSLLMLTLFLFGLCLAGILGSVGMFRYRLWGWITVVTTAGISIMIAAFVCYLYFSVLNALAATNAPMLERMDERAIELYRSARRQIHLTYWLLMVCYLGYAASTLRFLMGNDVFESYRSGTRLH